MGALHSPVLQTLAQNAKKRHGIGAQAHGGHTGSGSITSLQGSDIPNSSGSQTFKKLLTKVSV